MAFRRCGEHVDRLECLEQVLRIDPAHALASKGAGAIEGAVG